MKALVLTANQTLEMQEREQSVLDAHACRVKILNAGVCSSDVQRSYAGGAYFYPLVIGHEMAGEVIEIGANISTIKPGDRVVIFPLLPCFTCEACHRESYAQCHKYSYYGSRQDGGFAEYLDVKEWNILKLPDDVTYADAAAIEPMSVVVHALKKSGLLKKTNESHSVAIIGAGFLGLLMAQILQKKSPHCQVTIFDRNAFKLDIAKQYVTDTVKLQNDLDWQGYIDTIGKNTYGTVVEATGIPSAFVNSIELAAHNGKVLWLGNITDDLMISKKIVSSILRKELTIQGTWNSDYIPHKCDDWKDSLQLIQEGVRPSLLVTHWAQLEEVPELLKKLFNHKIGKERFESIKVMVGGMTS